MDYSIPKPKDVIVSYISRFPKETKVLFSSDDKLSDVSISSDGFLATVEGNIQGVPYRKDYISLDHAVEDLMNLIPEVVLHSKHLIQPYVQKYTDFILDRYTSMVESSQLCNTTYGDILETYGHFYYLKLRWNPAVSINHRKLTMDTKVKQYLIHPHTNTIDVWLEV